jgi:hypothetical protein
MLVECLQLFQRNREDSQKGRAQSGVAQALDSALRRQRAAVGMCVPFRTPDGMSRGQPRTRPGKPGFDSGLGYFERLSDLSDGIVLHHLHLNDLTKPRLELPDGSKHTSMTLAVKADILWARAGILEFKTRTFLFCFTWTVEGNFRARTASTKDHQRGVNRNPGNPGIEA